MSDHYKQYIAEQENDIEILKCSTGYVVRTEEDSDIVKDLDSVFNKLKIFYGVWN